MSIPPQIVAVLRDLPPDLKQSIKAAIRALAIRPESGVPLRRELEGLWKYRVRRFRIVYEIDRRNRCVRLIAVASRATVYEDLVRKLRRGK